MRNPSSSLSVPDPTPALFLVTISAVLVWVVGDAGWLSLLIIGAAIAPFLFYQLFTRPMAGIMVLVVAASMPRLYLEIGGVKARPEHIAAGVVCLAIPYWWKRNRGQITWTTADYLLLLYIATNYFCSAFVSIAPGQTIKWATQQLLVILPYFFLRVLLTSYRRFRQALNIMLAVGVAEAILALVCFHSNRFFDTLFGMEQDQYGNIPGTFGTQLEANILGSTSAAYLILLLTLYFKERNNKLLIGAAIAYAGLAISLSRAAVLAAGVAMLVLVVYALRAKITELRVVTRAAFTLLAVTLALAPMLVSLYNERFSTVDVSDVAADDNTRGRLVTTALAFDDILEHPILGSGTASFQLHYDAKDLGYGDLDQAGWIGNTEVRILYDMGAVGVIIFGLFAWYLARPAWKLARREHSIELLGLLLSAIVYCIAFQFTEGTLLAFSWVHLGLIGSGIALLKSGDHAMLERGLLSGNVGNSGI